MIVELEGRSFDGGAVEDLYNDYLSLVSDLANTSPSGLSALNRSYHKHLLVAAASSLEERVKRLIPELFAKHGRGELSVFVAKRVMVRNYATLFDWKVEKAKGFFTSFGEECATSFSRLLIDDEAFRAEHDAFMQLGHLRNEVVHNDYARFNIQLTPEEILDRYGRALRFTDRFESLIFLEARDFA